MTENYFPTLLYPFNLIRDLFGESDNLNDVYITGILNAVDRLHMKNRIYIRLRYHENMTRVACANQMNLTIYEIEKLERMTFNLLRHDKENGRLTARSLAEMNKIQNENTQLRREKEALHELIAGLASGEIPLSQLVVKNQQPKPAEPYSDDQLKIPIENLDLTTRAYNQLKRNGWHDIYAITSHTRDELLALRGVGLQTTLEIDKVLAKHGRNFLPVRQSEPSEPPAIIYNPELKGRGFNPNERIVIVRKKQRKRKG